MQRGWPVVAWTSGCGAKGSWMDVQRTFYREDHELFRTAVRRFLERDYLPRQEAHAPLERQLWLKAGREGLLCVTLPAQFGGGGDFGHAAIICEEFARAGIHERVMALHSQTIAPCIASLADEQQQQRWLPGICSGQTLLALAVSSAHGEGAWPPLAVRDGNDWLINGSTCAVGNGGDFDLLLLACQTVNVDGSTGLSLIMVERTCAGVHRTPDAPACGDAEGVALSLADVRVPFSHLLGDVGGGQAYLDAALSQEHLLSAIFSAAYLERLVDLSLDQAKRADDQGQRSWDRQNTRYQLADIKARAVALRLMVDHYLGAQLGRALTPGQVAIAAVFARQTLNSCVGHLRPQTDDKPFATGLMPGPAQWPLHELIAEAM